MQDVMTANDFKLNFSLFFAYLIDTNYLQWRDDNMTPKKNMPAFQCLTADLETLHTSTTDILRQFVTHPQGRDATHLYT